MNNKSNAAIEYHPEAYVIRKTRVMGLQSAGKEFLRGFVRWADVDAFYCYARDRRQFEHFERQVEANGGDRKRARWISYQRSEHLASPGCLYQPDPGIARQAWVRRRGNQRAYSLCGVTHTICTMQIMEDLGALLSAPVQSWDAVICTSQAVRQVVESTLDNLEAYLAERLNARPRLSVQLPVIPLGVDCEAYEDRADRRAAGREIRRKLGVGDDELVVLFVGRLSYHAKAHPLPMYRALEIAAQRSKKQLWLLQVGWFPNETIGKHFTASARNWCPSVRSVFLDGQKPDVVRSAWFAADIFTSLPNNIQETFGLAPIEAMAAGLPQVVSDWNGLRDTVRDGVDGFRVPTVAPGQGANEELAWRYYQEIDNYDHYIGYASQMTAVDLAATAEAYLRLIENPRLRASMGQSARQRARDVFDWRVIIGAYQDLWADLSARRAASEEVVARRRGQPAHPLYRDPFSVFACYPTHSLALEDAVMATPNTRREILDELRENPTTNFARFLLLPYEECVLLVDFIQSCQQTTVKQLVARVATESKDRALRTVAWMLMTDLLKLGAVPESLGRQ